MIFAIFMSLYTSSKAHDATTRMMYVSFFSFIYSQHCKKHIFVWQRGWMVLKIVTYERSFKVISIQTRSRNLLHIAPLCSKDTSSATANNSYLWHKTLYIQAFLTIKFTSTLDLNKNSVSVNWILIKIKRNLHGSH